MSDTYGLDEDESYRFCDVQELIEAGPKLAEFKEEAPGLYRALDTEMDGLLSDFEEWYDELSRGADEVREDLKKLYTTIDMLGNDTDDEDGLEE